MALYELTMQIIPVIYISLFLDSTRARPVAQDKENYKRLRNEYFFHYVAAVLGLVAFATSAAVVTNGEPFTGWVQHFVLSALCIAVAALFAQVLNRIRRPARPQEPASE